MFSERLTKHTVHSFAILNYSHPNPNWQSFFEDLRIFAIVSKSLILYSNEKTQNLHAILNNLIQLGNRFDGLSLARLAFYFIDESVHEELFTILQYMKRMPDTIPEVTKAFVHCENIIRHIKSL